MTLEHGGGGLHVEAVPRTQWEPPPLDQQAEWRMGDTAALTLRDDGAPDHMPEVSTY